MEAVGGGAGHLYAQRERSGFGVSAANGDNLHLLVRQWLGQNRLDGAWHIFFLTRDGQELLAMHVYEQDRAERIARAFRDGVAGQPNSEIVVAAPTKETDMEANRQQECEFTVEYAGERWDITQAWIAPGGKVAWYDGKTVRDGVTFFRTFGPDEIDVPQVEHA
jgi:hypothetical protein